MLKWARDATFKILHVVIVILRLVTDEQIFKSHINGYNFPIFITSPPPPPNHTHILQSISQFTHYSVFLHVHTFFTQRYINCTICPIYTPLFLHKHTFNLIVLYNFISLTQYVFFKRLLRLTYHR